MLAQNNGKKQEDTPMCEAAYGKEVWMGFVSAAVQNWTYHLLLDPGAGGLTGAQALAVWRQGAGLRRRAALGALAQAHAAACTHRCCLAATLSADAALVCCLLVIYTDLLEWNALGGIMGM